MRILRIVSSGYEQGGAENGIVLTNDILRRRGHDVRVLSSDSRPELPHFNDYEFMAVPEKGIKKFIYAAFNFSAYKVTKKILVEFNPDVVMLHTMSQPTGAVMLLLKKYPTIQFVHGPEIFTRSLLAWYLPKNAYKTGSYSRKDMTPYGRLRYLYFRYVCGYVFKLGLRRVDRIVALSGYTLGLLRKEGYNAIYVPNGAKLMKPSPILDNATLLYAGRLEKFKGVDDLLRAMPAILEETPAARLKICGDGGFADELKLLARDLGIDGAVEFTGHLAQGQLAEAYREAKILILPSIWPETFGKVGIEAMSLGRPVIATNVGGVKDWLRDGKNGFLVETHAPNQIAERVNTLLNDEKLLKKFSIEAVRSANCFSVKAFATNIERLATHLLYERTG